MRNYADMTEMKGKESASSEKVFLNDFNISAEFSIFALLYRAQSLNKTLTNTKPKLAKVTKYSVKSAANEPTWKIIEEKADESAKKGGWRIN